MLEQEKRARVGDREADESLQMDFGPEDVWRPLKGNCVELSENQYVYKFCPFDKATQRDKVREGERVGSKGWEVGGVQKGGAETSLGVWGEWAGPEGGRYSVMKMVRGAGCWNGPERTTVVRLGCGTETRLLAASEPGRCEYEFSLESPAACTDPNAHHAADEL